MVENYATFYTDKRELPIVCYKLLKYGYDCIAETSVLKHYNFLKTSKKEIDYVSSEFNITISDLIKNHLFDCIKISMCFENYLKAILINKGYLVHFLEDSNELLYREQKKRPIHVNELDSSCFKTECKGKREKALLKAFGIKNKTIGFNELKKQKYLRVMNIKNELFELFEPYQNKRNELHFYHNMNYGFSVRSLNNFSRIIDFVNEDLISFYSVLLDEMEITDDPGLKPLNRTNFP